MDYVSEFVKYFITIIIDAVEEFFDALIVPSTKFTFDAFLVSLGFLGWSILSLFTQLPNAVSWQEALTCSILMGIIVLIDTSVRSSIKSNIDTIKQFSTKVKTNLNAVKESADSEYIEEGFEDESGEG